MQDDVRALGGLQGGVGVGESGEHLARVVHRLRVVDGDLRALELDLGGDVERGRVADVVRVGLERGAEDGDPPAQEAAGALLARQLDHPGAAAHVDRVDLAEEGQRLVGAQFAGPRHERPDVLGQTAAAEAQAGVEELAADPVVQRERCAQLGDVRAGRLADLGHRVDEGDLGGQEGVGGGLHQLGGRVVGDQERHPGGDRLGVHLAQQFLGPPAAGADHDPVRAQGVLDGEALAQELRVPGELGTLADGGQRGQPLGQPARRADRDGGLADHQHRAGQMRGERVDRGVHVRHVGRELALALRGVDADEVHVAELGGLLRGGGEPQPAGRTLVPRHMLEQQLGQARLVHRDLAGGEGGDLLRVDVQTQHLEAELRHGGGVGGAEIAGTDHGDAEGHGFPFERATGEGGRGPTGPRPPMLSGRGESAQTVPVPAVVPKAPRAGRGGGTIRTWSRRTSSLASPRSGRCRPA